MSDSFGFFLSPKVSDLCYTCYYTCYYTLIMFLLNLLGQENLPFSSFSFLTACLEIIFLLVWPVLQKPPISAIIAVVD